MDNVTHALFLAFAMFALVLGLAYSMYLINSMNSVASTLIQTTDSTRDYQTVGYDSSKLSTKGTIGTGTTRRIVGIDTVVSTIYGYNKESYSVEIRDSNGKPVQIFDLTIENILANPSDTPEYKSYSNLYGAESDSKFNMFGAPWIVSSESLKQRIDMYISGKKGYINGTLIDYSVNNEFPNWVKDGKNFSEQFIQYTYDGETISTNGEDIETITGSRRAQNKILIIYTLEE